MKKAAMFVLASLLFFSSLPWTLPAYGADNEAQIIDKHGAKTYMGNQSSWGKTWDDDNFEEVTNQTVNYSGSVTVKAGTIKNLNVSGSSSKVDIQGGTMDDVSCDGTLQMTAGSARSVDSNGDMKISGGTIKHDVTCDAGDVSFSNTVAVGGSVAAKDVTIGSGMKLTVTGTITGTGTIYYNPCTLKVESFGGDDQGTLEIKGNVGNLPPIEKMSGILVDENYSAVTDEKLTVDSLILKDKAQFSTDSLLEVGSLQGPGTLVIGPGRLKVDTGITGKPLLVFNKAVEKGVVAFTAEKGTVQEDDVKLYDYGLEKSSNNSGDDEFKLTNSLTDGVFFDKGSLSLAGKTPGLVKATIKPDFSKFADGTKLVWQLYGDTAAFSISADSTKNTCTVTASGSTTQMHKATLVAYLEDKNSDRLNDYRSDSCVLSTGYSDNSNDNPSNPSNPSGPSSSGVTLDTAAVSILAGSQYCVFAATTANTAPAAVSYNSSVASVGAPSVAVYKGQPGYLYPVTGVSKGGATVDIGGQKVIVTVSRGIMVDTSSYTMSPGARYIIGVKVSGYSANELNVHSLNACTDVQLYRRAGGTVLYRVTAKQAGTGCVLFELPEGQVLKTQFQIEEGVSPHGVSARMVALA